MKKKIKNYELTNVLFELQQIELRLSKISLDIKDYWQTETEIKNLKESVAQIYKTIAIQKLENNV